MKDIRIRRATLGDAEYMASILREIGWSEKRNSLPLKEVSTPIEKLIRHCLDNSKGHTIIVAVNEDDAVLGFVNVHWVPFLMLGNFEGYVSDVFVSPSASGRGVGNSLIKYVIKEGEERGCMRLMLTNGQDKPSYKRGFYRKMGWTERPKVANFVYYYSEPWS